MGDIIAYIPARDSSKRLPLKNIAFFNGKTLVENTIDQAKEAGVFDRIILSSNSDTILAIGKTCEVETHKRDDSQDKIIDVLRNDIRDLCLAKDDIICILLVTCPLRSPDDIKGALEVFKNQGGDDPCYAVVTIKKNENPVQMSFVQEGPHLSPFMPLEMEKSTRKQDHQDTYFFNDGAIIDSVKNFLKHERNLYGNYPLFYEMPWDRSIAIDYAFQLEIAQLLGEDREKWRNLRG